MGSLLAKSSALSLLPLCWSLKMMNLPVVLSRLMQWILLLFFLALLYNLESDLNTASFFGWH
ncbi:MAG: hypothetical protein WDM90_17150 [Ferruginibacter sp.]